MQNAGLDEAQARIKIARRNINNLRYAGDITLESKEELKSLSMKVNEESGKNWLKTQRSKSKDHGIQSHDFIANEKNGEKNENSDRLNFLELQNHCRWLLQP